MLKRLNTLTGSSKKMGRIYLIRHGQTDSNSGGQFQGRIDNPLNRAGMEQVRRMTSFMHSVRLDAVYCSSLLRARMTAAPLAMDHNLAYRPMEELEEICFGLWEGVSFREIHSRWPREMTAFLTTPADWTPPGGESLAQVKRRCDLAMEKILAEQGSGRNIAVISHGGIIRVQLCSILGMPLNNIWKVSLGNVSVTTISNWDGNMGVECINDCHFL